MHSILISITLVAAQVGFVQGRPEEKWGEQNDRCFRLFNISENSNDNQIKQAFRKFSLENHPDITKNNASVQAEASDCQDFMLCLHEYRKHDWECKRRNERASINDQEIADFLLENGTDTRGATTPLQVANGTVEPEVSRTAELMERIISNLEHTFSVGQSGGDEQRALMILELREKVASFQSIIDGLNLELDKKTFIISDLSLKMKRMKREKDAMIQELVEKNDTLKEMKILLEVAKGTQNQIIKECGTEIRKWRNIAESEHFHGVSFPNCLSLVVISAAMTVLLGLQKVFRVSSETIVIESKLIFITTMWSIRALISNHHRILGHIKTTAAGRTKLQIIADIRRALHANGWAKVTLFKSLLLLACCIGSLLGFLWLAMENNQRDLNHYASKTLHDLREERRGIIEVYFTKRIEFCKREIDYYAGDTSDMKRKIMSSIRRYGDMWSKIGPEERQKLIKLKQEIDERDQYEQCMIKKLGKVKTYKNWVTISRWAVAGSFYTLRNVLHEHNTCKDLNQCLCIELVCRFNPKLEQELIKNQEEIAARLKEMREDYQ